MESINSTRMSTFIKAKLKKSDDQTNMVKFRVVENITEYRCYIKINIPKPSFLNSRYGNYFM